MSPPNGLTPQPGDIRPLQSEFLDVLPTIQNAIRLSFRSIPCSHRRADLIAEALALCWKWFLRLAQDGRSPAGFVVGFARMAARAVASGRRLCGQEKTNDVLSPVCQFRRGLGVWPLPSASGTFTTAFEQALQDNTQTPVPDQVQFRVDFPRWRLSLSERTRALMDAMALGHRTSDLAVLFGVTSSRVSQLRQELFTDWRMFCGDDRD